MLLKIKTNQNTLNKYLNSPFSILIQRNNFANSINFKLDKLTSDFIISKSELQEGINAVKLLNEKEVLCEIARISSGEVNEVTLQYANELRKKVS